MHITLPFADDEEFGRLHAATRLLLPILPALAASSPVAEGRLTGLLDTRMEYYRTNARRVPCVSGLVIPERLYTRADYEKKLLGKIYDDLAPLDPAGVLRHEWVNGRGCIARFDRSALEIRVLDVQECPRADIAVAGAAIAVLKALVEDDAGRTARAAWPESTLAEILAATVAAGEGAEIADVEYLRALGFPGKAPARAGELWQHLIETVVAREPLYPEWAEVLKLILRRGCLAARIAAAGNSRGANWPAIYRELGDCLRAGALFDPDVG
jgi:hypothetical protein